MTDNDIPLTPDEFDGLTVYETLQALIGDEKTETLCKAYGGYQVYLPYRFNKDNWLVNLIGYEAAEKLSRHYTIGETGVRIIFPMSNDRQGLSLLALVGQMMDEGQTVRDIVRALRIHERTVYRLRARIVKSRCEKMGKYLRGLLRQELSVEEIAHRLGISPKSIELVINKIREMDGTMAEAAE